MKIERIDGEEESTLLPPAEKVSPKPMVDIEVDPAYLIYELAVDVGVNDLALNVDHYLYGFPKAVGNGGK